jgi:hypothetical protein
VSFSFGATVAKPAELKKALEDQRNQRIKELAGDQPDLQARTAELEELVEPATKAAEAAVRGLKGGSHQVTIGGHLDTDGTRSISVSVRAVP